MISAPYREIEIEFLRLYIECLENPPTCDCEACCSDEVSEENLWLYHSTPAEIEAFESAVCCLRHGAAREMDGLEFTALANEMSRKYLIGFDIEYHDYHPGKGPADGEGWSVSWQPVEAAADAFGLPALERPNTDSTILPPRGATYLLWRFLPSGVREAAVGDLGERFERDCARIGACRARLTYWEQVAVSLLDCLCPAAWAQLKRMGPALKNFALELVKGALSSALIDYIADFIKGLRH